MPYHVPSGGRSQVRTWEEPWSRTDSEARRECARWEAQLSDKGGRGSSTSTVCPSISGLDTTRASSTFYFGYFFTTMKTSCLPFGLCAALAFVLGAADSSRCKCFPGDDCWPSKEEFEALNNTVNGRLVATVPLAIECHDPHFDNMTCSVLQSEWLQPPVQYVIHGPVSSRGCRYRQWELGAFPSPPPPQHGWNNSVCAFGY